MHAKANDHTQWDAQDWSALDYSSQFDRTSKTEVIRCPKRYVAREVYSIIRKPNQILAKAA